MSSSSPLPPQAKHASPRGLVWGGAGFVACALLALTFLWLGRAEEPSPVPEPQHRQRTGATSAPRAAPFTPQMVVTQLGTTAEPAPRAPIRVVKASPVVQKRKKVRGSKRHKGALSKRAKRAKKRSRSGARRS